MITSPGAFQTSMHHPFFGGDKGGAGGGGTAFNTYDDTVLNQWYGWIKGTTDSATYVGDLNVADAMLNASSAYGGSPFELVAAIDPSDDLASVKSALDDYEGAVSDYSGDTVEDALDSAKAWADDNLRDDAAIEDVVELADLRSRRAMLRNMTSAACGLRDIRGVMSTQFGAAMVLAGNEHASHVANFEVQLRLASEREWRNYIVSIGEMMHNAELAKINALANVVVGHTDYLKVSVAMRQDQQAIDIDYEVKDALWDLELFNYGGNILAALAGAAVQPRGQTRGERIGAAITTSLAGGLQLGMATGNVGAGIAGMVVTGLAQIPSILQN